ncbi:MAG: phage portal protein [Candidatus Acinetobacter avistercoris]|uniref:phage portal protein n=1 Tax=Acinetobacter sp. KS-LM10 TaxID=3120518 RepID=UPI001F92F253|nr:phage portal protein [Candidatus Acinetobacter avistercoris]
MKTFLQTLNDAVVSPKQSIKLTDGALSNFFSSMSNSGESVSVEKALKLDAVWACVRLISETISTLPLVLYERQEDGSRKPAKDHPLFSVLRYQPNIHMTSVNFTQALAASLLLQGNGYTQIKRNNKNEISSLNFMLPTRTSLSWGDREELLYKYTDRDGRQFDIGNKEILHIPAFSLDGRIGLSPIRYGANTFGSAMSADNAANGTFKNGLLPTVAFKVDRVMNDAQREAFRGYVKQISGAMNAGTSPVLEQGVTPQMIGINPADAQLLESRNFGVETICRWFRVPGWMIGYAGKGQTKWGSGMEQEMIGFLQFTLRPWLVLIEQSMNKTLLTPAERTKYYVEFNIENLLRADSKSRADFYSKMVNNGIYTRDEVREKENLPKFGGVAAELTVQSQNIPIDDASSD